MKYLSINNNIVAEIIPEIDNRFPEVSFKSRFALDFTEKCIPVDDDFAVSVGMVYDNGIFTMPEPIIESSITPLSEVDLEQLALDHEYRLSMLEIGM